MFRVSPKDKAASLSPMLRATYSLLAGVIFPFYAFRGLWDREFASSLQERLGKGGWTDFISSLRFAQPGRGPIWLHAASVGELTGLYPLVRFLKEEFPGTELFVTTTSLTGRSAARERELGTAHLLFPFDHPRISRNLIEAIRPRVVVIAETEIWPGFLTSLERSGVPVILINARISDRTFPRYSIAKPLLRPFLRGLTKVLAQSSLDAERFRELGVEPNKIIVSGSTKYSAERRSEMESEPLSQTLGLSLSAPIFVAGSVRPVEDEMVVAAYVQARNTIPKLQLIIAPRHPERFMDVEKILIRAGLDFNKRSLGDATESKSVLLLDTLGELSNAYRLATVAFVGGTLVPIGGHNPLEAAQFRVPVILGPHSTNVRDAVSALKSQRGMFEVRDASELHAALETLLRDELLCKRMGSAAFSVWESNLGALECVARAVEEQLAPPREDKLQAWVLS